MMDAHELITRYKSGERDFSWANLREANLAWANVTREQLGKAASLPDGTKHE